MIDYIKVYLININIERLLNLSASLDFKGKISKTTGEINEDILIAKYLFCQIIIQTVKTENNPDIIHVTFKGSIHKMWNELHGIKAPNYKENKVYKGFNGNQFTIDGIIEIRKHLETLFDCNSNQMKFQNVEFGVNTTPKFNPLLYLKGLLYHNNILFEYQYNGNYAQAVHQFFIFKLYNKSFQYGMSYAVLRVELKIIKMEELKGFGIKTFEDINENTLNKAKSLLLRRFDEIMHYDYTIQKNKLSRLKLESLKNYANPRYWIEDLKPNHRDRPKKELKGITANYSGNIHQQIKTDIIEKCVMINRLSETANCVINNYSNIWLNTTRIPVKIESENFIKNEAKKSVCILTGLDISMQKDDSILLSHSGLRFYFENDKKEFEQIKNRYLSKRWSSSDFETQIKEIAHNIRNKNSNQSIKQSRIYKPQQVNMFSCFD